jgi:indolepyruvate ferredoxin oxidoreductase alpha subunit
MQELLSKKPGKKILLGNEAICRGALEAGVQFVSTYPGTPASEIGNIFYGLTRGKNGKGLYFEFSTNEKIAMEAGMGASFSGLKTLVAMKNFGLNVCIDSLLPFVYTGAKGPFVLIVADDPSCHSSAQTEENTRPIASWAKIPVLEPSDPQECKDFVKFGFKLSEQFKIPVIVRTSTRVAHQKMPVVLEAMERSQKKVLGKFIKNPRQFITLPPRVLEMKNELLEKIERIRVFLEKSSLNRIEKGSDSKIGIITSAISYLYTKEALAEFNLSLPVLKLGFFYPLPEEKIKAFIKGFKKVLIVEELEPFLEREVERLAKEVNCDLEILGKKLIPETGEMRPETVFSALARITGRKYKVPKNVQTLNPKRLPQLCAGCPYWSVIAAVKKAVDPEKVIFGGEIGCYMLFGNPPVNMQDYLFCMGSSIGIGHGIKKATGQKLIAFVGDSSFFHSGIPALVNAVFNKSNPLVIILNNETTAMTGHQPHPVSANSDTGIKIENVVRACGVKNVKTLDPLNQEEMVKTVKDFMAKKDVSVIIANRPCLFVKK